MRPTSSSSPATRSTSSPVTGRGRAAHVAVVVDRLAAERAQRPAGPDDLPGALRRTPARSPPASGPGASRSVPAPASSSSSVSSSGNASTTTCAVDGSQPRRISPARNSSSTGWSRGSLSTSSAGVAAGTLNRFPSSAISASRISSIFSASTADCSFSSADARAPSAVAHLQVEGAGTRATDGADDDAVGPVELVDKSPACRPFYEGVGGRSGPGAAPDRRVADRTGGAQPREVARVRVGGHHLGATWSRTGRSRPIRG